MNGVSFTEFFIFLLDTNYVQGKLPATLCFIDIVDFNSEG